jgi:hypothetical protein
MIQGLKSFKSLCLFIISIMVVLLLASCAPIGWYRIEIKNGPPAATGASIAYNSAVDRAIMFGGTNSILVNNAWQANWINETWEWDGEDWTKLLPTNSPPAREKHVMTYDKARNRIVLFGGSAGNSLFNDTWEWDGVNWHLMNPEHTPPARCCHAMAYDSSRKQVVLYGGWDSQNNTFFNDIWLWDGKDWSQIPSDLPQMSGHFLVDFPSKSEVISIQTANNGTWAWDGKSLKNLEMESPPSRTDVRAVYDPWNNRAVLFGGIKDKTFLTDTWVFNGDSWFQIYLTNGPSPRFGQVMFYDVKRNSIVLFGGFQNDAPYYLNDMWELKLPSNLSKHEMQLPPTPATTP